MGSCLSSSPETRRHSSAADVILSIGLLRQFCVPVKVSQVLLFPGTATAPSSFFLCNADSLYFDERIPAMDAEDELEAGQIYFVLPAGRLQHRLAASDMAALAVTASAALRNTPVRGKISRISPVIGGSGSEATTIVTSPSSSSSSSNNGCASSSAAAAVEKMLKLQTSSSRRVKMAGIRTFRLRLVTINEGSVLGH